MQSAQYDSTRGGLIPAASNIICPGNSKSHEAARTLAAGLRELAAQLEGEQGGAMMDTASDDFVLDYLRCVPGEAISTGAPLGLLTCESLEALTVSLSISAEEGCVKLTLCCVVSLDETFNIPLDVPIFAAQNSSCAFSSRWLPESRDKSAGGCACLLKVIITSILWLPTVPLSYRMRLPPHPSQLPAKGPTPKLDHSLVCRGNNLSTLIPISVPGSKEQCVKLCTSLHNVREAHMIDLPSDMEDSDSESGEGEQDDSDVEWAKQVGQGN